MNLKTTLALLVLAAAGGALAWFGPSLPPAGTPPTAADAGSRQVLETITPDNLLRVEVRRGDRVTVLERPDAQAPWALPGRWPVRAAEANALIELLGRLRSRFEPEPLGDDLTRYGLGVSVAGEPGPLTVRLTTTQGTHTLLFGEPAAATDGNRFSTPTYVRVDDKPEVLRLAPGLLALLDRPADFYQQRRLFPAERVAKEGEAGQKVERLVAEGVTAEERKAPASDAALAAAGAGLTLHPEHRDRRFRVVKAGDEWHLAEPVRDRLDLTTRDTLLSAVPDIWAERFVDADLAAVAAALAAPDGDLTGTLSALGWASVTTPRAASAWLRVKTGLDRPERSVTVRRTDGRDATLLIGKLSSVRVSKKPGRTPPGLPPGVPPPEETVREEFRYAQLKDNPQVFEVRADKLKDVFADPSSLRDSRVVRFNSADVRRVEIERDGRRTVLVKEKDRWKLAEPIQSEADTAKVDELLNKLTGLDARKDDIRDPGESAAALAPFGLDKPAATVKVTVEEAVKGKGDAKEKRTRTVTVQMGKKDDATKKVYVKADNWPRVNAVDESLEPLVTRPALAYRGNKLFDFGAADLAALDVRKGDKTLSLKQDRGAWKLAAPVTADADAGKAGQLAGGLANLEVVEYVSDAPAAKELEGYGLDKPALTVTMTFADKDKKPRTLEVGKAREGKPGYFAKLADAPGVFAVNNDLVNLAERDALAYLPEQLWQLAADDVTAVRVRRRDGEYRLTRDGDKWKVSGPFDAAALPESVQGLIGKLLTPKAEKYLSHDEKDPKKYGLDKPALAVVLTTKDGKEHGLEVAQAPDAKDAKTWYARKTGGGAVFEVSGELVGAADRSALDLLDPVLAKVEPARLDRVVSQADDIAVTLERKGETWRATAGPGAPFTADEQTMAALLAPWLSLKAERYAAYGPKVDMAKYGLDKPAFTVTVRGPEGAHTVELGAAVEGTPGARYARVDKGPGIAVLGADTARALAHDRLDFVDRTLLQITPQAITAIIRQGGGGLELARRDGAWRIVKPRAEDADEKVMQEFADQLAGLRAARIAAYPADDAAKYGLDAPLIVTVRAGDKQHVIRLGKETRGGRFATVDDGKAVAVLPADVATRLAAGPLAFRDRTLVRFTDADTLRLERGPRRATFAKVDGNWKLTEPLTADAEQDALDDFVNDLARLRADEYVAEKPADLAKYGLDRPEARWHALEGTKEVLHLVIGRREANGPRHYAKIADRDVVFLLDPKVTAKALGEFRPRAVWTPSLDAAQVESLRYTSREGSFLLEKSESGTWQIVGKPELKVNAATVTETLDALAGLKLERYAEDKDANFRLYGLEPPELAVEAATRSGKRTLHLGRPEGNTKRRYARVAENGRTDVFVIGEDAAAKIARDAAGFTRPPLTPPRPAQTPAGGTP